MTLKNLYKKNENLKTIVKELFEKETINEDERNYLLKYISLTEDAINLIGLNYYLKHNDNNEDKLISNKVLFVEINLSSLLSLFKT